MARRRTSRILPVVLVLIAIVIATAVLISLAKAVFLGDNNGSKPKKEESSLTIDPAAALLDTAADRSVSLIASGPIVAQENFRSYQIVIGPSSRKLILYEGYLGTVVDSIEYSNNITAYAEFVNALYKANLVAGVPIHEEMDRDGICATGEFYEFDLLKDYNRELVARYWTSTCGGSPGTLKANARQIIDLFIVQVPEARQTLKKINIYGG